MSNPLKMVAAVDLGSNSFHLLIGRVSESALGIQIHPLDSLKEVVRLAGGLGSDKRLDAASQTRALLALQRFGERLRSFSPDRVRAVATNTLRIAKNGGEFLKTAEAALGFPIEVITEAPPTERTLLGLSALEKAVGKSKLPEILGDVLVKPQGRPTVVPESDPREGIDVSKPSAEDEFGALG